MGLDTLRTALRDVEENVPYNNFRPLFDLMDKDFPDSLGGDCYLQARHVAGRLGEDFKVEFMREIEGNHVVVFAKHRPTQQRFVVDPLMLIGEPIPMGHVLRRDAEPLTFPLGGPDRAGHTRARVEYGNRGPHHFAATLYNNRFDPDDYVEYLYDSRQRTLDVPSWTSELLVKSMTKEEKFVLRFALPDRGVVVFRYDIPERVFHCTHHTNIGVYRLYSERTNEASLEKFGDLVLERLGTTTKKFRRLLVDACRIREQVKPSAKRL